MAPNTQQTDPVGRTDPPHGHRHRDPHRPPARVWFRSDDLSAFAASAHTDRYVKLVFPKPGVDYPEPLDMRVLRQTLPPEDLPVVRTYTALFPDVDAGTLAIDFVVHGDEGVAGPVGAQRRARATCCWPTAPAAAYRPDPDADWHLFVGDESARSRDHRRAGGAARGRRRPGGVLVDSPADEPDLPRPGQGRAGVRPPQRRGRRRPRCWPPCGRWTGRAGRVHVFAHGEAQEIMHRVRPLPVRRARTGPRPGLGVRLLAPRPHRGGLPGVEVRPLSPGGRRAPPERPRRVRGVQTGVPRAGDEGLARRLKALACTAPLHDLDARKARLDWVDAERYQMAEIGLQAIDQVTLAMDFDHGADQPEVVRRLLPFIGGPGPGRPGRRARAGRPLGDREPDQRRQPRPRVRRRLRHDRRRRPLRAAALRLQAARRAGRPGRRGLPARVRRGDQRAGRRARHRRRVGAGRGRGEAREPHQPRPARRRPAGRRAGPLPHRPVRRGAAPEARRHPPRRALGRLARRRARAARRGARPHREPLPRGDRDPRPHRHRPRRGDRAVAAQAGRGARRRRARLHPAPHPAADPAAGGGRGLPRRAGPPAVRRAGRAAPRSTCSASSCGPASRLHVATALEPTAAFFRAGHGGAGAERAQPRRARRDAADAAVGPRPARRAGARARAGARRAGPVRRRPLGPGRRALDTARP